MLSYFYDAQIRRYIEQIQRVFSNFQILEGINAKGSEIYRRIPCAYGDPDRMAAHLIRGNTENATLPVPFIAVYDTGVSLSPHRRRLPNGVDSRHVFEREFVKDAYTENPGKKYTVDRFVPVPYDMTINVDLWYTKTDHKLQLCEQIMTIFNPDINIQTNTNPLDWTALTVLEMDGITWNSRGVPSGVDDAMRITTFSFKIPIFINPPAKLKIQNIIKEIITNVHVTELSSPSPITYSIENLLNISVDNYNNIFDKTTDVIRTIITPGNHYIQIENNTVILLGANGNELDENGNIYQWSDLFTRYSSELRDDISLLRLRPVTDIENTDFDYIGRLRTHTDKNKLFWTADLETIPQNNIPSVNAIIDPNKLFPGGSLPSAAAGQRYLLLKDLSAGAMGSQWNNIKAMENDIIEFDGTKWSVSFNSAASTTVKYTINNHTNKKLSFTDQTHGWIELPDGVWSPGFWKLAI